MRDEEVKHIVESIRNGFLHMNDSIANRFIKYKPPLPKAITLMNNQQPYYDPKETNKTPESPYRQPEIICADINAEGNVRTFVYPIRGYHRSDIGEVRVTGCTVEIEFDSGLTAEAQLTIPTPKPTPTPVPTHLSIDISLETFIKEMKENRCYTEIELRLIYKLVLKVSQSTQIPIILLLLYCKKLGKAKTNYHAVMHKLRYTNLMLVP